MGGDHKCPVCQATFTRPQHVARHMRSHTGDRPYKCQYCGDQFARSDLLSRHVNKCHANEKPLPSQGSRRKGSASASRATTSKQACDQCVQSSLPCDGSNPCAKCVQRKCRCTYVKFHRQTAPVGPGHNPRPIGPPNPLTPTSSSAAALASSRIPISYQADEFFLTPAPPTSMADTLYQNSAFSFPPLYPEHSGADFTSKYRAQAELLRNNSTSAHFAPTGGTAGGGTAVGGPGIPGSTALSPSTVYSSDSRWVGSWAHDSPDPYHTTPAGTTLHDKDMQQHQHGRYVNHQHHNNNNDGVISGLQQQQQQHSSSYVRRGSVDFASGSEGSGSQHSIPSSASSSSVHLPLDTLQMAYNQSQSEYVNLHHHQAATGLSAATQQQRLSLPNTTTEDTSPSFFPPQGMNLNESNMLTGLTSDAISAGMVGGAGGGGVPADDPDATPMPLKEAVAASGGSVLLPGRSASASGSGSNATSREGGELRELREFWKQYMRTPLSGENPTSPTQQTMSSPPGYRRPRVASMPSSNKTPTIAVSLQQQPQQQQRQQGQGQGRGRMRTTLHNEDLRSYEAAVLARKAPTTLNLVPKLRRGTVHGNANDTTQQQSTSLASPIDPAIGGGFQHHLLGSRPSSSLTNRSGGSSGNESAGGSSSLAGAFGADNGGQQQRHLHHHHHQPQSHNAYHQHQQQNPHLPPTYAQQQMHNHSHPNTNGSNSPHNPNSFLMIRRGSPASSTSTTGGSSSRASSVSTDHDGDIDIHPSTTIGGGGGGGSNEDLSDDDDIEDHDDGGSNNRNVDSVGRLRPSFKRLASTTLGRPDAKRQFLGGVESPTSPLMKEVGENGGGTIDQGTGGLLDMGLGGVGMVGVEGGGGGGGFAPGALGMH